MLAAAWRFSPTGAWWPGGSAGSLQGSVRETQTLVVMSGGSGTIVTGENIPWVSPYQSYAQSLGLLPAGLILQTVSTGFTVEPIVVGEVVRLNITPWMGYLGAAGRGQVRFSQASTSVSLRNGDSVEIGGSTGSSQASRAAFGLMLGGGTGEQSSSGSVTVSATVMPP